MAFNIENRRYTGSKAKLLKWIIPLIEKECRGNSFADIFAGTGVVAAEASKKYQTIIINDFLHSNYVIFDAFFGKTSFNSNKIDKMIDKYNQIDAKSIKNNYFSINYGNKYFDNDMAKVIGYIRDDIERNKANLTKREYNIILTCLIYAVDKNANTVGHYDAYIKKPIKKKQLKLQHINPIVMKSIKIFRENANVLVDKIRADIVYIDPPYNSRQYSRFYHLLENLVKWNKPELHGEALKPLAENTSDYCLSKARAALEDLVSKLKCKYIVVSYNNTYASKSSSSRNKIELNEIKDILKGRGNTKIFKTRHRHFNSGKTSFNNHQEWLFITSVNEKNN